MKYLGEKHTLRTKTTAKVQLHNKYIYSLSTCTGKRTGISIGIDNRCFEKLKKC